jgi:hypothetical protein
MAAPEYVPTSRDQQPRRGLPLPPARRWLADRPGELGASQPHGPSLGTPGPDQGYALSLAARFHGKLDLGGATEHDAIAGCLGTALQRASLFGRAPVIHDLDIAFRIWGFLGDAPAELVELRNPLFEAASHHYWDQRAIVDRIPEETLRMTHQEVAKRFPAEWPVLVGADRRGGAAA